MAPRTMRELERVRYWQGQLLASRDLRTQIDSDAELRALHNRSIHGAYGVAVGLNLSLVVNKEQKIIGELACGVAYDCNGRALHVEASREVALPPPATDPIVLVVSHDPSRDGGIAPIWKLPREIDPFREIAVAGLIFDAGTPNLDPNFKPVVARPIARPRLATGTTIAGETPWKSWKIADEEIGVEVTIDTSAAGYTQIPHYFAEAVEGNPSPAAPNSGVPKRDLVWFASIAEPSPESFKLQLMLRGIARQALSFADPKVRVTAAQKLDGSIKLSEADNPLKADDIVARLLPIGEQLSLITAISNKVATLDGPLQNTTSTSVAFGNLPRTTFVTEVSGPVSVFAVTVDNADSFRENDVVVKLGANAGSARPAKVVSIDDSATLELSTSIAGLVADDPLGIARPASTVVSVTGLDITVSDSTPFSVNDVVVRLSDDFENSTPAIILGKKPNNVLTLSAAIGLKSASTIGIAREAAKVIEVADNAGEVKIQVDNVAPFRAGDLVAKITKNIASRPVRVQHIKSSSRTLTLSQPIAGLKSNDIIAAASFPVRATVLAVDDNRLTLNNAALFPKDTYVACIDDVLKASAVPMAVNLSIGKTLMLEAKIPDLAPGDVVGVCVFPPTVQVEAISADGTITVSDSYLIQAHDVVTARGGLALVAEAKETSIRLAAAIANLAEGDNLAVATIRGAVTIAPGNDDLHVKIDQPSRLRAGDFLATIVGWRQLPADISGLARITTAGSNAITVFPLLDGLLTNDIVGLSTVTENVLQLRLNPKSGITPYETIELAGIDRIAGNARSMTARILLPLPADPDVVLLLFETDEPAFAFRPEDISASTAFVRGSALAQIQKHELLVNWLACGDGDQLPRPCIAKPAPACPCTESKE